ncbi:9786_t:CDS:1 [Ambispora gerdemannii]|uniref:9786_t:CDS:1 n=1 Tax=Ambispora gerdemannii TaxID=144530 RepID=A0A9N9H6Y5_9GLOM|nr:9786_t:CDS:1 [Ambispora gerdemannii]
MPTLTLDKLYELVLEYFATKIPCISKPVNSITEYIKTNTLELSEAFKQEEFTNINSNAKYAFLLGYLHIQGLVVQKSIDSAFKYFKIAAENGDTLGSLWLGTCYLENIGTPTTHNEGNKKEGIHWYEKSAKSGNYATQSFLAEYYSLLQPNYDPAKVFYWRNLGAESGSQAAQLATARLYVRGKGTNKDLHCALRLYLKSGFFETMKIDLEIKNVNYRRRRCCFLKNIISS